MRKPWTGALALVLWILGQVFLPSTVDPEETDFFRLCGFSRDLSSSFGGTQRLQMDYGFLVSLFLPRISTFLV